jgi:hypothetical protein
VGSAIVRNRKQGREGAIRSLGDGRPHTLWRESARQPGLSGRLPRPTCAGAAHKRPTSD